MNKEIEQIKKKLEENNEEKKHLLEQLMFATENYYNSLGLKKGVKVRTRNEIGILSHFKCQYGKIVPVIMKIKKDGTAHATATIWCFSHKDIDFDSIKELNKE